MKFTIKDYSTYKQDTSRNGGNYGFEETAVVQDGQFISGSHWTTSEFSFCQCCGSFEQHLQDHADRQHDGNYEAYDPSPGMIKALEIVQEEIANGPSLVSVRERATFAFKRWARGPILEIEHVF